MITICSLGELDFLNPGLISINGWRCHQLRLLTRLFGKQYKSLAAGLKTDLRDFSSIEAAAGKRRNNPIVLDGNGLRESFRSGCRMVILSELTVGCHDNQEESRILKRLCRTDWGAHSSMITSSMYFDRVIKSTGSRLELTTFDENRDQGLSGTSCNTRFQVMAFGWFFLFI